MNIIFIVHKAKSSIVKIAPYNKRLLPQIIAGILTKVKCWYIDQGEMAFWVNRIIKKVYTHSIPSSFKRKYLTLAL